MKFPQALKGYNECIWKLIKEADLEKAKGLCKTTEYKLKQGLIVVFTEKEVMEFEDYQKII